MGVCYRQSKRIWKRYQVGGDAGLVHHLQGPASARRKPRALRAAVLARYAEERYADFGPTLMAEHLAKEKLVVDHETLRRWRLAEGRYTVRRRKQKHRHWRERKPSFGAMVQRDGSPLRLVRRARPPARGKFWSFASPGSKLAPAFLRVDLAAARRY